MMDEISALKCTLATCVEASWVAKEILEGIMDIHQERISASTEEQQVGVPSLQVMKQIVECVRLILQGRRHPTVEEMEDVPVSQIQEQMVKQVVEVGKEIIEAAHIFTQERSEQRIVEQIVDATVAHAMNEVVEIAERSRKFMRRSQLGVSPARAILLLL